MKRNNLEEFDSDEHEIEKMRIGEYINKLNLNDIVDQLEGKGFTAEEVTTGAHIRGIENKAQQYHDLKESLTKDKKLEDKSNKKKRGLADVSDERTIRTPTFCLFGYLIRVNSDIDLEDYYHLMKMFFDLFEPVVVQKPLLVRQTSQFIASLIPKKKKETKETHVVVQEQPLLKRQTSQFIASEIPKKNKGEEKKENHVDVQEQPLLKRQTSQFIASLIPKKNKETKENHVDVQEPLLKRPKLTKEEQIAKFKEAKKGGRKFTKKIKKQFTIPTKKYLLTISAKGTLRDKQINSNTKKNHK